MRRLVVALRRRTADDESGFTLIEVVVALMLVTLVMGGFLAVTLSGVAANRVAEQRARANQLAQQLVESAKSIPWAKLGLYSNDCGYPGSGSPATDSAVAGERVVVLGATRPAGETVVPYPVYGSPTCTGAPQAGISNAGTTFQVAEHVTWTTPPGDDGTHQIKHVTVVVSWVDHATTRSVTSDATRAPTPIESPIQPVNPGAFNVVPTASGDQTLSGQQLSAPISISVTTNSPASAVSVSYPKTTGTATLSLTPDASSTTWTGTLPAATCCFNAGSEVFSVAATRASDNTTATGTAQVQLSSASANYLVSETVNPTTVQVDSGYRTLQDLGLTAVTTTGAGAAYVEYTDGAGATQTVNLTLSSTANGNKTWTGKILTGAGPLSSTSSTLSVVFKANGPAGSQAATVPVSVSPPQAAVNVVSTTLKDGANPVAQLLIDNKGSVCSGHSYAVQIAVANVASTDRPVLSSLQPNGPGSNGLSLSYQSVASANGTSTFNYVVGGSKLNSGGPMTFHVSVTRASDGANGQSSPDPSWTIALGC